jgi:hypothetical protein
VIKSQTKARKGSLEWERSRSPKARATAWHNRDNNAPKLPTPQGEAKGLDTIGKRARLKFRRKRAPQMHECKLPLNKCIKMNASSPWTDA